MSCVNPSNVVTMWVFALGSKCAGAANVVTVEYLVPGPCIIDQGGITHYILSYPNNVPTLQVFDSNPTCSGTADTTANLTSVFGTCINNSNFDLMFVNGYTTTLQASMLSSWAYSSLLLAFIILIHAIIN